ncbi:hypothetical protein FF1_024332 [Malus domestica]
MDTCADRVAKEVAKTMAAEAYSSDEEIKRLDSKLVAFKGSNISAPTSLQLETAHHEIVDLKTRLDTIQVKYESAENEIGCYIPQIQDLEFAISELRFAAYANDEELIAAYNQINKSLKKGVDELQRVRVSLLEKNEQLKGENDRLEAGATEGEASDDAVAKNVTAAEGVATEQARVAYAAIGVGVELCKVVSHRVGSHMPYLQKQTSPCNH